MGTLSKIIARMIKRGRPPPRESMTGSFEREKKRKKRAERAEERRGEKRGTGREGGREVETGREPSVNEREKGRKEKQWTGLIVKSIRTRTRFCYHYKPQST